MYVCTYKIQDSTILKMPEYKQDTYKIHIISYQSTGTMYHTLQDENNGLAVPFSPAADKNTTMIIYRDDGKR